VTIEKVIKVASLDIYRLSLVRRSAAKRTRY